MPKPLIFDTNLVCDICDIWTVWSHVSDYDSLIFGGTSRAPSEPGALGLAAPWPGAGEGAGAGLQEAARAP